MGAGHDLGGVDACSVAICFEVNEEVGSESLYMEDGWPD